MKKVTAVDGKVECSNTTGRVLKLFLNNTRESSQEDLYINASLFSPFVELKILNLSTNMLATLGDDEGSERPFKLNNLELLDLSNNTLDISILASLTELSSLKSLSLGTNILEGSIQGTRYSLRKYHRFLKCTYNSAELYFPMFSFLLVLSTISILIVNRVGCFAQLGGVGLRLKSLRKLRVLHLETNGFNISTLKSLGRLSLLKELYLGGNKLEGSVTLRGLDLSSTNISSSILQIVEVMTSLKALSLRSNGINGSQTALQGQCLSMLGKLDLPWALDLSENRFSGNLDSSLFAGLMKLEFLSLSHNVFQTFPPISSFAKHSKLEVLDLICGNNTLLLESEDQNLGSILSTQVFRLSSCILKTGYFQQSLARLNAIKHQRLSPKSHVPECVEEFLEGSIPSFGGMRKLLFLDLSNNLFTGGIPRTWPWVAPLCSTLYSQRMICMAKCFQEFLISQFETFALGWQSLLWKNPRPVQQFWIGEIRCQS
ncbi:putative inactive leucine-rich repeat receptor kinase XIAO [Vitis vinifera]|uniref:Putative inactive leucine-rich repeat receptor kinase XIAO n=1 Tax=Vitis vinifera TaxID=29760 RepID=A0A438F1K4_VITVI|nr:putative inactive leucine-rich repeat receptor kinase XIAO [Vitis vinifera]